MFEIDRPGAFRGTISEWGVGATANGFPQFVARFFAEEHYNEETSAWEPWAEFQQDIAGYLVLYTEKDGQMKELLNAQQLKKALGWNGADLQELHSGNYADKKIIFRVETNDYNGKQSLKVNWIDAPDASPLRALPKLDNAGVAAMNARFASVLGKKPAAAPAKAPARPTAGPASVPAANTGTAASTAPSPTSPAGSSAPTPPKRGRPPKAAPAAPAASAALPGAQMTKESAWEAVNTNELRTPETTDEILAKVWVEEVTLIGKPEDQFTGTDWMLVSSAVIKATSKF